MQKHYRTGEVFSYLGETYPLEVRVSAARAKTAGIADGKLLVFVESEEEAKVQEVLFDWYKKQAKKWIAGRVRFYAQMMGETVNRITIKNQKKRWGSCSSARNLNFNWRLILYAPEAIDYVVVHEICHLKQMNHSKAFWKEVENILPDYKERKAMLREELL